MRRTGDTFEKRALQHLRAAGLQLLDRNFNTRFGELDLVMADGETLVFVEVRYRRGSGFGGAASSVTRTKQARLVHAAQLYLQAHPRHAHRACRFDVVAFEGLAASPRCEWRQGAFEA